MLKTITSAFLISLASLSVAADNTKDNLPIKLTGEILASVTIWNGTGRDEDSFLGSIRDNVKAYAKAYMPEMYKDMNGNEIKINRNSDYIISKIAHQIQDTYNDNQVFYIEKTFHVGDYDFNDGQFELKFNKNIFMSTNTNLNSLLSKLGVRFNHNFYLIDKFPKQDDIYLTIKMSQNEADNFITKYPNRAICERVNLKNITSYKPEKDKGEYVFTGDVTNYSYRYGTCKS